MRIYLKLNAVNIDYGITLRKTMFGDVVK